MSFEVLVAVGSIDDATDRDLIRRIVEGDEDAFGDLFRRYGAVAKALALRVIRQPFLAEEIAQEAFTALWRNPDEGPGRRTRWKGSRMTSQRWWCGARRWRSSARRRSPRWAIFRPNNDRSWR